LPELKQTQFTDSSIQKTKIKKLNKEIEDLKIKILELEKSNELHVKSMVIINQNIKTLMTFMKDVGQNQQDIATQVFTLTEAFNELVKSMGIEKEQYTFFNGDEDWN